MSSSAIDALDLRAVQKIYLSGPVTGHDDFVETFATAATDLRARGLTVFNPAEHQDATAPSEGPEAYRHYMAFELPEVTASDAVVVLPDWTSSAGARLEVHTAVVCSIPVLSYPDLEPVDTQVIVGRRTQTTLFNENGPVEVFPDGLKDTWADGWIGPFAPPPQSYLDGSGRLEPDQPYFKLKRGDELGQRIVTNAVTGGQKETRPARFDLLPWDQLWKVAELYAYGAIKYEDRNWERGYAYSLSIAALLRHMAKFVQGENDDPESGCPHLASVVFHALALMRFVDATTLDEMPADLDDRPVGKRVRAREDAE